MNMGIIHATVTVIMSFLFASFLANGAIVYNVDVDTGQVISTTEEEYLSFTLEFSMVADGQYHINFSDPLLHTLVKGLSPATLRFGGGSADTGIFYNVVDTQQQKKIVKMNTKSLDPNPPFGRLIAIFPQAIDGLYSIARSAGGSVLYCLNIELRYGAQWDSTNARAIMDYVIEKGYADFFDFELGNEPPYKRFGKDSFNATGTRIGKDFLILKHITDEFGCFNNSRIVGPDVETPRDGRYTGNEPEIMREFVETVKHNASAITAHHYYFSGPDAQIEQFYNITYFKLLETTLPLLRKTVYTASGGPISIWIGETADSYKGGTPNITNTYASGFLWLDKLGIAAQNEIKLIARQTLRSSTNYPLLDENLDPNPDYWLSYVFKKLVGRSVLQTKVTSGDASLVNGLSNGLLRVYAHCASPRSRYIVGSIVLYAINLNVNSKAVIDLPSIFKDNYNFDFYLMTPENNNITSRVVLLNGVALKVTGGHTLPVLNPVPVGAGDVKFPPFSFGFLVMYPNNKANSKFTVCS